MLKELILDTLKDQLSASLMDLTNTEKQEFVAQIDKVKDFINKIPESQAIVIYKDQDQLMVMITEKNMVDILDPEPLLVNTYDLINEVLDLNDNVHSKRDEEE